MFFGLYEILEINKIIRKNEEFARCWMLLLNGTMVLGNIGLGAPA